MSGAVTEHLFQLFAKTGRGLAFLGSDKFDSEIEKKSAHNELIGLLRASFDIDLPPQAALTESGSIWKRRWKITVANGGGSNIPLNDFDPRGDGTKQSGRD